MPGARRATRSHGRRARATVFGPKGKRRYTWRNMPTYEYVCKNCGHRFDVVQSMKDEPLTVCPNCGEPQLRKVFAPPAIAFKGSGFYATDQRNKATSRRDGGGDKGDERPGSGGAKDEPKAGSKGGKESGTGGSSSGGSSSGGAGTGGSPSGGSSSDSTSSSKGDSS